MVFLAMQTYGWSLAQAVSKRKWVCLWQAALVVDGARAKDGAVAQGMIFYSNSSIACNKASFRSSSSLPKCPIKQFVAQNSLV